MRRLVSIALALVLVITLSSAFIRLSQSGLSCPEWPACYGAQVEIPAAVPFEGWPVFIARVVHRIAASLAGILFLVIAALGWHRWRGDSRRAAAVALVVLAGLLAWLGTYTPSALPAVMLGNLLGGMALLGLLAWLRQSDARGETLQAQPCVWILVALALVALQISFGGLIGARHAALACTGLPGCGGGLWPHGADWRAFDPFLPNDGFGEIGQQTLHLAHRLGALLLAVLLAWIGWRQTRLRGARLGIALLALIAVQVVLGAAMLLADFPVALAVAHNAVASLVLIVLASMLPRPQEKPG